MRTEERARNRATHDLGGRVVVVTGGGSGLGQALCRTLSRAGAVVVAADVAAGRADEVARAAVEEGGTAEAIRLDVRDGRRAGAVLRYVAQRFGGLDVLVNNAGTDVTLPFEEISLEQFDRVIDVNLRGSVVMAKAAWPHLRARGRGHVVNIVSTAAKRAWSNASAYHASKWGLLGFSHALHVEGRPHRIKVTAVVAGGMRTPFILDRFPDTDPGVLQDPANVADAVRFVLTQPDETVIPEVMVIPMRETSWP